jgi:hypothetical protein
MAFEKVIFNKVSLPRRDLQNFVEQGWAGVLTLSSFVQVNDFGIVFLDSL